MAHHMRSEVVDSNDERAEGVVQHSNVAIKGDPGWMRKTGFVEDARVDLRRASICPWLRRACSKPFIDPSGSVRGEDGAERSLLWSSWFAMRLGAWE